MPKAILVLHETNDHAHPDGHPFPGRTPIEYRDPPKIGTCFGFIAPGHARGFGCATGTVRGLKVDGATIHFRTRHSTYTLEPTE